MKAGLALDYAIVDRASLAPRALAERVLGAADEAGPIRCEPAAAGHALRLATVEPVVSWSGVADAFQARVVELLGRLEPHGARLLSGGLHPCAGALDAGGDDRAAELELGFADEAEFARLHCALRALLPILPALGAASPFADGRAAGCLDARIERERVRAARAGGQAGLLVPELALGRADGARPGANTPLLATDIARRVIRVRALDVQECPAADVALASALVAVLAALVEERDGFAHFARQKQLETGALAKLLRDAIRDGERALVRDPKLLRALGVPAEEARSPLPAGELWRRIVATCTPDAPENLAALARLDVVLREGPLARRLETLAAAAEPPLSAEQIAALLADHLERGRLVRARPKDLVR